MIGDEQGRICAHESGDLCMVEARDKDADLLVREIVFVNLDVVQEVISGRDIATMGDSRESFPRGPATRIVGDVGKTKVVVRRSPLGHGENSDLV